jgi:hypothetical protein
MNKISLFMCGNVLALMFVLTSCNVLVERENDINNTCETRVMLGSYGYLRLYPISDSTGTFIAYKEHGGQSVGAGSYERVFDRVVDYASFDERDFIHLEIIDDGLGRVVVEHDVISAFQQCEDNVCRAIIVDQPRLIAGLGEADIVAVGSAWFNNPNRGSVIVSGLAPWMFFPEISGSARDSCQDPDITKPGG